MKSRKYRINQGIIELQSIKEKVLIGIFDFLKGPDINQGLAQYKLTPGAVLLDVRTVNEYGEGHIPGSINIPLKSLDEIEWIVENKGTPIFVHCYSGARSRQAARVLGQMGYENVNNIGGIPSYTGEVA